jgi:hypothetical protein
MRSAAGGTLAAALASLRVAGINGVALGVDAQ